MKTKIDLLGTSFILHSDEESEHVASLVDYVQSHIRAIQQEVDCEDALRLSIMASLLITHELMDAREKNQNEEKITVQSAKKLIHILDDELTNI